MPALRTYDDFRRLVAFLLGKFHFSTLALNSKEHKSLGSAPFLSLQMPTRGAPTGPTPFSMLAPTRFGKILGYVPLPATCFEVALGLLGSPRTYTLARAGHSGDATLRSALS